MKQFLLHSLILLSFESFGQNTDTVDLRSFFGDFTGGFCVYDIKTDHYIRYNPGYCEKRFSPCSTFKIPNSLIRLETGMIPDTGFVIPHDSIRHPKDPYLPANDTPFVLASYFYGRDHARIWRVAEALEYGMVE